MFTPLKMYISKLCISKICKYVIYHAAHMLHVNIRNGVIFVALPSEPLVGTLSRQYALNEDQPLVTPMRTTNFVCTDAPSVLHMGTAERDSCFVHLEKAHGGSTSHCEGGTSRHPRLFCFAIYRQMFTIVPWFNMLRFILLRTWPFMLMEVGLTSMHKTCRVWKVW